MSRHAPSALLALFVAMLGPAVSLAAEATRPGPIATGPRPVGATQSGSVPEWRTTIVPAPALRAPAQPLVTGALPPSPTPKPLGSLAGGPHALEGIASFYWQDQKTANGERFDKAAMTAAHKTLPFNTRVRVTHVASGRSVVVRINDRGPFKPGRVIDLSYAAAGALGMHGQGLAKVRVEVVE